MGKDKKMNSREKLNPERVQKMLHEKGVEVTLKEAEIILNFLRKLANSVVSDYLGKPNTD